MDLKPNADQQQLIDAFAGLYADLASTDRVSAAEPSGHDAALWQQLVAIGAVEMALPDSGAGLIELALVAEQHGRYLAPAPMIEAQVAARLLAQVGGEPSDRLTTLAVRPAVGGRAELVPAGAVADDALMLDGDRLLLVPLTGRATAVANLGCLPLADVDDIGGGAVLATGAPAVSAFEAAVDEWRVLTAAALSGLAAAALEIGVAYVKERTAFDRPLGAFQGVAHRLADRASEVDGAQLLAREAAWAHGEEPERFAELAAMALGFAAETAADTTWHALHFHGGYGFMLEYPIQMYFRRARTWGAVLESPAESYRRVTDVRGAA
ncbi:MAG: acyl-CoA dehydrogenase [Frankiaceae bacterium]|nr:acyl-CoA dehydrogenase [Frankiaceae bacterium]MBV9869042.1 acyl-CoA dehydrogenase [Frankiaceae bacterium]